MTQIAANLRLILSKIQDASMKRSEEFKYILPRLVAVSKTKPIENIIEAYDAGQMHFGENYAEELIEKATSNEIITKCPNIKWHFIGNLQSNKIKKVLSIPNLYLIETIDSVKKANKVNQTWKNLNRPDLLNVMIQVNTSGEEQKNGIDKNEVVQVYEHVKTKCDRLNLVGLMTIGSLDASLSSSADINVDFASLADCRKQICEKFGVDYKDIELSMGMSHDFERAILMGSANVRVGSSIFGSRQS